MNKKKRALLSRIVFLSVFCISAIFYIPASWYSIKPKGLESKATTVLTENTAVDAAAEEIELFSYSITPSSENPQYESQEDNADLTSVQMNQPIAGNTGITAAPLPTTAPPNEGNRKEDTANAETTPKDDEQKKENTRYANIGISAANDFVNIRAEATTDGEILGKLYKDSAAEIIRTEGDWFYIESGSVKGYIKAEFLITGLSDQELVDTYGEQSIQVEVDGLNVRKKKDKESDKLDVIYLNEIYPVLDIDDEWVKIKIPDENTTGYVMREFTDITVQFKKAVSKEEEIELLRLQAEEKAKEETKIKQQEAVDYSYDELMLLACLVHAEAGTQSYEGKLAVANIVLNRIKSSKYPDTMKAVIYQSGQFSVARSGSLAKQLANYENFSSQAQRLSIKAAKAALSGSNNIGSRLYFHSYRAAVRKGYDQRDNAVKIDDQLFW